MIRNLTAAALAFTIAATTFGMLTATGTIGSTTYGPDPIDAQEVAGSNWE